jgi:hypothetical protein
LFLCGPVSARDGFGPRASFTLLKLDADRASRHHPNRMTRHRYQLTSNRHGAMDGCHLGDRAVRDAAGDEQAVVHDQPGRPEKILMVTAKARSG